MNTKNLTLIGVMSAVLCILGPWSLAIPLSPVPVSLGMLAVYLTAYILGMKKGTVSVAVYLLLGTMGLPVFTGFGGGIGKVLGPTGGYMLGYLFMGLTVGFVADRWRTNYARIFSAMLAGTALCYLFGSLWLARTGGMSFGAALGAGALPFIPGDLVKMAVALVVGTQVKKRLWHAGILEQ